MSRWVVQRDHVLDGVVTEELVSRWVDDACSAYLDLCPLVGRFDVRREVRALPPVAILGTPTEVCATASATEVLPDAFTLSVRLRPLGGDRDTPLNATCVVRLADRETGEPRPVGDDVRDELIALEHAARHFN